MDSMCELCGNWGPVIAQDYMMQDMCAACASAYPGHAEARRRAKEARQKERTARYTETMTFACGHTVPYNRNGYPRRAVVGIERSSIDGVFLQHETLECGHVHHSLGYQVVKHRRCTECPHMYADELKQGAVKE